MAFDFYIMRSLIYVGLAKEEYRPKLMQWPYRNHVSDSISKFGPYCIKYAFYQAYPTPEYKEKLKRYKSIAAAMKPEKTV